MSFVAKLFGINEGNPLYNPNADINEDGIINIKDISIAAETSDSTIHNYFLHEATATRLGSA